MHLWPLQPSLDLISALAGARYKLSPYLSAQKYLPGSLQNLPVFSLELCDTWGCVLWVDIFQEPTHRVPAPSAFPAEPHYTFTSLVKSPLVFLGAQMWPDWGLKIFSNNIAADFPVCHFNSIYNVITIYIIIILLYSFFKTLLPPFRAVLAHLNKSFKIKATSKTGNCDADHHSHGMLWTVRECSCLNSWEKFLLSTFYTKF